ncbi:MAG: hypothetical protein IKW30_11795 [Lachnospiraceae bacterium]|nr:hypothetical protein [Lachnospiraceae bacterium]
MKRIIYLLLFCFVFCLTGCNSKEEAMAIITEVPCETVGISFSLNGLWMIQDEAMANSNVEEGQTVFLSTYKEETGSAINVICDDLTKTEGATLVRLEDYIADIQEQLKISSEYSYACSEVTKESLYGQEYQTFSATVSNLGGEQKYYIRRKDDTIIILLFSVFGEDQLNEILALGKEM